MISEIFETIFHIINIIFKGMINLTDKLYEWIKGKI